MTRLKTNISFGKFANLQSNLTNEIGYNTLIESITKLHLITNNNLQYIIDSFNLFMIQNYDKDYTINLDKDKINETTSSIDNVQKKLKELKKRINMLKEIQNNIGNFVACKIYFEVENISITHYDKLTYQVYYDDGLVRRTIQIHPFELSVTNKTIKALQHTYLGNYIYSNLSEHNLQQFFNNIVDVPKKIYYTEHFKINSKAKYKIPIPLQLVQFQMNFNGGSTQSPKGYGGDIIIYIIIEPIKETDNIESFIKLENEVIINE